MRKSNYYSLITLIVFSWLLDDTLTIYAPFDRFDISIWAALALITFELTFCPNKLKTSKALNHILKINKSALGR